MENFKRYSLVFIFVLTGCSSFTERNLNSAQTAITDCDQAPHCVSSLASNQSQLISPIQLKGDVESFQHRIKDVLLQIPRVQIKRVEANYIHAEATSLLMRFTDDIEFYFEPSRSLIQVRSSSRIGYSDLGVNRSRVEKIRTLINSSAKKQ